MKSLPEGLMGSLYGSLTDGTIQFSCWYDGNMIVDKLPSGTWDQRFGQSQTAGSTSLTVVDESGELAPWGVDDPLGVGGSILQSRLLLNSVSVPMGWQRITASQSNETWRTSANGIWVSGGATIDVTAEDLTKVVAGDKFVSPETPQTGSTCIAEIRRLLLGIMEVTFEGDITDALIPPAMTYRDERMSAVEDLVAALGCAYRVTGTGALSVYKPNREIVWVVEPGMFTGSLISVSRSQSISELNNLIVARNTLQGGKELQAAAEERSGPLRTNGPHGRWPTFFQADFAMNQFDMIEAAKNQLDSLLRERTVAIPLTTIFHPGLEIGDWIQVLCPVTTGTVVPLEGRVNSINYAGGRVPRSMALSISCDLDSVQTVSEALKAQRWRS